METLGSRIRKKRRELKLTQRQVSDAVDVSHVTVSQWEQDLYLPKNIDVLAQVLQCNKEWLKTGKNLQISLNSGDSISISPKNIEQNAEYVGEIEPWGNNTELSEDEVEVPFYTEIELAAGSGSVQVQQNHGPKLRFAKSTLKRHGITPENAACVKVSGNSMEPVLPDGATVGVDTASTKIVDGKMFAIDHDGMLRVKTLYRMPGNGIR